VGTATYGLPRALVPCLLSTRQELGSFASCVATRQLCAVSIATRYRAYRPPALQRLKSRARMPWLMERYVFNACLCHVLAKSEFWSPNWCLWIWPDDKFAKVKILYPAKIATKPKHDIVRPSNINVHQSAPLVWLQDSEGVGETLKFGWIGSQFF